MKRKSIRMRDEEEEEAYESGKSLKGQTLPELEKGQEIKRTCVCH